MHNIRISLHYTLDRQKNTEPWKLTTKEKESLWSRLSFSFFFIRLPFFFFNSRQHVKIHAPLMDSDRYTFRWWSCSFYILKNLDHTISLERYLTRPKANCFKSKLFSHLLIVISYPNGILTKYELCYSRHLTL